MTSTCAKRKKNHPLPKYIIALFDRFHCIKHSSDHLKNSSFSCIIYLQTQDSASTSPKQDSNHKHSQVLSDAMKNLDKQSEQPFRKKKVSFSAQR